MGGAMQPQGHTQIVCNIIDFGMNLQEAGDAPRISHGGSSQPTGSKMTDGGEVSLESGFSYQTIRSLMSKGHKIGYAKGPYGGYQAIMWNEKNKVYYGASESRKDGQANRVYILLQGGLDDLLGSLAQTGIDHFHARVPQVGGDDSASTVMAVETDFGDQYAARPGQFINLTIVCFSGGVSIAKAAYLLLIACNSNSNLQPPGIAPG